MCGTEQVDIDTGRVRVQQDTATTNRQIDIGGRYRQGVCRERTRGQGYTVVLLLFTIFSLSSKRDTVFSAVPTS